MGVSTDTACKARRAGDADTARLPYPQVEYDCSMGTPEFPVGFAPWIAGFTPVEQMDFYLVEEADADAAAMPGPHAPQSAVPLREYRRLAGLIVRNRWLVGVLVENAGENAALLAGGSLRLSPANAYGDAPRNAADVAAGSATCSAADIAAGGASESRSVQLLCLTDRERADRACDPAVIDGGTFAGCAWHLTDDGVLSLRPAQDSRECNGTSCMHPAESAPPWLASRNEIKMVVACQGVAAVGAGAFAGCPQLLRVVLGRDTAAIGRGAFAGCGQLRSVAAAGPLELIGAGAFAGCGQLREVGLVHGVSAVESAAFEGCASLWRFACPAIGRAAEDAFSGCAELEHPVALGYAGASA